ncbi:hypothetical protein SAMN04487897_11374 [Paenibacillus sp. yr247]|uniref:hypothetical protein n=1 Tax=Paenibacillus sp. yr247 TaxID=1761880 RepID=UPI0008890D6A|nr:hypothetical protein [Paenibacillus sp. yr247]SDO39585.1 hypothetical protein SAMN04487897_11374 [Paenibacillus sp. yr247]
MISVLWRVAISGINNSVQKGTVAEHLLHDLKEEWRKYLIGKGNPPINTYLHLYLVADLENVFPEQIDARERVYSYFERILDIRTISGQENIIIYAKLPGILLVSNIGTPDYGFVNTEVNSTGTFTKGQQTIAFLLVIGVKNRYMKDSRMLN